jgi:hypothetical protein
VVNLLELLDQLDASDVHLNVTTTPSGVALRTDAPAGAIDNVLADAIRMHKNMVIAVVIGRRTGHAPGPCTRCGEVSLVTICTSDGRPRTRWPRCRFSVDCANHVDVAGNNAPGRHIPRPADIDRTRPIPPPAEAQPPAALPHKRWARPWPTWPTDESRREHTTR